MFAVLLYLGYYGETALPNPLGIRDSLFALAARAGLLFLAAVGINRLFFALLHRNRMIRRRLAVWADIGLRMLLVAVYAESLESSTFPWSLAAALGLGASPAAFLFQLSGILPFVLFFVIAWFPMYGLHREVAPGNWTRPSFQIHQIRSHLVLLIGWLPFALLTDWLSGILIAIPILLFLSIWTFPFLLARIWGCRRLADSDVLGQVARLEKEAGVGFSRVYLWEPGGGQIQNAAAVGIFRPFRYLFLTPALLRDLNGPELEAVVLHELGHVKHRHLLFYFFSSLAGVNASVIAAAIAPLAGPGERFAVVALLILIYFRLIFGWLSRNMERQADLFALETSGSARNIANALEKLALAAGHIRLASSWHHSGIAERVRFLHVAERNPQIALRHNRRVTLIQKTGYLFSILLLSLIALIAMGEDWVPRSAPVVAGNGEAHWRRLLLIFPEHPVPPLELAYLLAGGKENDREALRFARLASRLATNPAEQRAAEKLMRELGRETP
ncbi:MAG: M48 family metalloprotease [Planctomycetota bacterium]|jgi:Zn-dependent protease with chaperone function|nr:M48 family metalloprotease [Planctomycetota bacterium]